MPAGTAERTAVRISEHARAVGSQLRADAFAIRHAMLSCYDRRPEKRQEQRLEMDVADAQQLRRWLALMQEFSPTLNEKAGTWPNGTGR